MVPAAKAASCCGGQETKTYRSGRDETDGSENKVKFQARDFAAQSLPWERTATNPPTHSAEEGRREGRKPSQFCVFFHPPKPFETYEGAFERLVGQARSETEKKTTKNWEHFLACVSICYSSTIFGNCDFVIARLPDSISPYVWVFLLRIVEHICVFHNVAADLFQH